MEADEFEDWQAAPASTAPFTSQNGAEISTFTRAPLPEFFAGAYESEPSGAIPPLKQPHQSWQAQPPAVAPTLAATLAVAAAAPAAASVTLRKGQAVWYLDGRTGSWLEAKVLAVDQNIQPPSYCVELLRTGTARETELPRLQPRQPGAPPPPPLIAAGNHSAQHSAAACGAATAAPTLNGASRHQWPAAAAIAQAAGLVLEDDFGDFASAPIGAPAVSPLPQSTSSAAAAWSAPSPPGALAASPSAATAAAAPPLTMQHPPQRTPTKLANSGGSHETSPAVQHFRSFLQAAGVADRPDTHDRQSAVAAGGVLAPQQAPALSPPSPQQQQQRQQHYPHHKQQQQDQPHYPYQQQQQVEDEFGDFSEAPPLPPLQLGHGGPAGNIEAVAGAPAPHAQLQPQPPGPPPSPPPFGLQRDAPLPLDLFGDDSLQEEEPLQFPVAMPAAAAGGAPAAAPAEGVNPATVGSGMPAYPSATFPSQGAWQLQQGLPAQHQHQQHLQLQAAAAAHPPPQMQRGPSTITDPAGRVLAVDYADGFVRRHPPAASASVAANELGTPTSQPAEAGDMGAVAATPSLHTQHRPSTVTDPAGRVLAVDYADGYVRRQAPAAAPVRAIGSGTTTSQPPAAPPPPLQHRPATITDPAGRVLAVDFADGYMRRQPPPAVGPVVAPAGGTGWDPAEGGSAASGGTAVPQVAAAGMGAADATAAAAPVVAAASWGEDDEDEFDGFVGAEGGEQQQPPAAEQQAGKLAASPAATAAGGVGFTAANGHHGSGSFVPQPPAPLLPSGVQRDAPLPLDLFGEDSLQEEEPLQFPSAMPAAALARAPAAVEAEGVAVAAAAGRVGAAPASAPAQEVEIGLGAASAIVEQQEGEEQEQLVGAINGAEADEQEQEQEQQQLSSLGDTAAPEEWEEDGFADLKEASFNSQPQGAPTTAVGAAAGTAVVAPAADDAPSPTLKVPAPTKGPAALTEACPAVEVSENGGWAASPYHHQQEQWQQQQQQQQELAASPGNGADVSSSAPGSLVSFGTLSAGNGGVLQPAASGGDTGLLGGSSGGPASAVHDVLRLAPAAMHDMPPPAAPALQQQRSWGAAAAPSVTPSGSPSLTVAGGGGGEAAVTEYAVAWSRLLQSAAQLLQAAAKTWAEAVSTGSWQRVQHQPEVQQRLAGVAQVYCAASIVRLAAQQLGLFSLVPELQEAWGQAEAAWHTPAPSEEDSGRPGSPTADSQSLVPFMADSCNSEKQQLVQEQQPAASLAGNTSGGKQEQDQEDQPAVDAGSEAHPAAAEGGDPAASQQPEPDEQQQGPEQQQGHGQQQGQQKEPPQPFREAALAASLAFAAAAAQATQPEGSADGGDGGASSLSDAQTVLEVIEGAPARLEAMSLDDFPRLLEWSEGLCCLTLLPLSLFEGHLPTEPWAAGHPCLVPLANLWLHRVSRTPPQLD